MKLTAEYLRYQFPNGVIVGNASINDAGDRANLLWDRRSPIDDDVIILAKYNCEEVIENLDRVITFKGWGEVWCDTLRDLIIEELRRG